MNWKELIEAGIDENYKVTYGLLGLVEDDTLDWKPETGSNWMTTGQLLKHITTACGFCIKGFVTGDWGMPEGMDPSDMSPDDMLPPAEKLPTVSSVAEARKLLEEDEKTGRDFLSRCTEDDLANKIAPAPWDPSEMKLGHRLLQMVIHLQQHKGQLFYYLKLQGKDVNTQHLWGM
jgi:uncharacterized damage-inducible protein DinB